MTKKSEVKFVVPEKQVNGVKDAVFNFFFDYEQKNGKTPDSDATYAYFKDKLPADSTFLTNFKVHYGHYKSKWNEIKTWAMKFMDL